MEPTNQDDKPLAEMVQGLAHLHDLTEEEIDVLQKEITRATKGIVVDKKVSLELAGQNNNPTILMEAFQKQARREGWTEEEIDTVLNEAKSIDYNHFLTIMMNHIK